jgi:hypothetical protein
MTDTPEPRRNILPSDVDAQGGVVLWDHGPREYTAVPGDTEEQTAAKKEQRDREVAQWKAANGEEPVVLRLHQSDAAHAIATDPGRYSMEPSDLDEGEIIKRMEEIRARRQAALDSPQIALDRKTAIESIMSDRRSAVSAAAVEERPASDAVAADAAAERVDTPPRPILGEPHTGADGPAWYPPQGEQS